MPSPLGGIFDFEEKKERLTEVLRELEDPQIWNDQERAQTLGRERSSLETVVLTLEELFSGLDEAAELLEMAAEEGDEAVISAVEDDLERYEKQVAELEARLLKK